VGVNTGKQEIQGGYAASSPFNDRIWKLFTLKSSLLTLWRSHVTVTTTDETKKMRHRWSSKVTQTYYLYW